MAFSHRPTWHAARGQGSTFDLRNYSTGGVASRQIAELDMANHMTLKFRDIGQGTKAEISTRDLEKELREKEREHFLKNKSLPKSYGPLIEDKVVEKKETTVTSSARKEKDKKKEKKEDEEIEVDYEEDEELKGFDDKDDEVSEDSDSSSDDDSDDDDEEELMRELEKIKREREEEKIRKEEEGIELEAKLMKQQQMSTAASSGLGKLAGGAKVKRRWDQDVVFRNQAAKEPENKKRFINDTIRNDFHRKFLSKLAWSLGQWKSALATIK